MYHGRPKRDFRWAFAVIKYVSVPADGLANGRQEVLSLLSNGRKCLKYDMTIFGTDPERTRLMIQLEMEPGEILVHEDVRYQLVLLPAMHFERRETGCRWLSIP